ncbi:MAG: hypothetical protein IKA76_00900 [Clostridia bacterium]|nr:hypothetical protein [Clostridia bacterium]
MKPMMKYMTLVFILFLMTSGLIACGENAEESQDSTQSEHTELVTEPETETEIDSETETEAELETETETETETEAETETDPAQSESEALSEYRYDLHEFTIVRPKGKNSAIDQVVGEMYEAMISMGIDEPMVTNDDGLSPDPSRKEILIGATNQPESEETAKRIKEINEYAIAFYENKIVISVARDEAYPDATEALLTGCFIHAEGGVLSVERDHAIVGKASFQTVTLYQNKKLSYNVVLPKKPSEADQALAGMIVTRLEQYTGILADIIYAGDVPYNKNTKSILIGDVGYPECAEAYEGLEKNECAIRVVGNKIVLCGRFIMTREWACNLLLTKMAGEWSPGSDSLTLYVTEDWKGRDNSLFLDFPEFTDGEEVVAPIMRTKP